MAGPLPQQFRRQAPLASRETFACLSVDKKRLLSPFVRGESSWPFPLPFQYIKKSYDQKRTELFQTSNLDKRSLVLPCGLHRGKRSPQPHPLKQAENSIQATLGKRRQLLSRRELFISWQVFTLILRRLDCPSVSAESYED